METSAALKTFPAIIKASDGRITNGTLDRIRRAVAATNVDMLAELGQVFGVEPWQLLVPG